MDDAELVSLVVVVAGRGCTISVNPGDLLETKSVPGEGEYEAVIR
jgi:hypothetical protein